MELEAVDWDCGCCCCWTGQQASNKSRESCRICGACHPDQSSVTHQQRSDGLTKEDAIPQNGGLKPGSGHCLMSFGHTHVHNTQHWRFSKSFGQLVNRADDLVNRTLGLVNHDDDLVNCVDDLVYRAYNLVNCTYGLVNRAYNLVNHVDDLVNHAHDLLWNYGPCLL